MKKMSLSIVIFIYLIGSENCLSQNVIFSYDASGNRVYRTIVLKETKADSADRNLPDLGSLFEQTLGVQTILVYPNPTLNNITIQCSNINLQNVLNAYLYSAKGDLLTSFQLNEEVHLLNLENYATGIYYLKILNDDKLESWKIIKQ